MTTATAAAVLGVGRKALDNILGRIDASEIPKGRQGVERRIPVSTLLELLMATELSARLGASSRESHRAHIRSRLADCVPEAGARMRRAPRTSWRPRLEW